MDAGVAALLGALVGGVATVLGTVIAPLVQESIRRRSIARDESRAEVRRVLHELLTVFAERGQQRHLGKPLQAPYETRQNVALFELGLVLNAKDLDLFYIAAEVGGAVNSGVNYQQATTTFIAVATQWFQGKISSEDLRGAWREALAEATASPPLNPSVP